MKNQCDGCARKLPIENGIHHNPKNYHDAISCTAHLYQDEKKVKCKCGEIGTNKKHFCPFRVEIDNDKQTLCNCCKSCRQACLEDI